MFVTSDYTNMSQLPIYYFAGSNNDATIFLQRGGHVIIRMRGLPYEATAKQVVSKTFT